MVAERDTDAFAGIFIKLRRAQQHLELLAHEMGAFQDRRPYVLLAERYAKGAEHIFRLHMLEPIPVEWSVILGEAIHDLRSALDHVVYQLYVANKGRSREGTGFPICATPDKFNSTGKAAIRGLGKVPQAIIESLQPYPDRNAEDNRTLLALQKIWNQDKHQLIHMWGLTFNYDKLKVVGTIEGGTARLDPSPVGKVLRDEAVAIRVLCDPPDPKVSVHGEGIASVAFDNPADSSDEASDSVWTIFNTVRNVLARLAPHIMRPDGGVSDEPAPKD